MKWFGVLGLCLLVCSSLPGAKTPTHIIYRSTPSPRENWSAEDIHLQQLASLSFVFYKSNGMPAEPSKKEMIAIEKKILSQESRQEEVALLKKMFKSHYDLMAYAVRDTDGDGVKDYLVNQSDGKFHEGDLDLDGDGIKNVYDLAPYDRQRGGVDEDGDGIPDRDFEDQNHNGIPDHVDWEMLKKANSSNSKKQTQEIINIQSDLFKKHKLILVERNTEFNYSMVLAISDAISIVYKSFFDDKKVVPTLRAITAEKDVFLNPEADGEIFALILSPTSTMDIFQLSMDSAPLVQLGLLVHEVCHTFQYALDYDTGNELRENGRQYFPMKRYMELIRPLGWKANFKESDKWHEFEFFAPLWEVVLPKFYYKGWKSETWTKWLENIYDEVGEKYLEDPRVVKKHIVGDYSLTDAREWLCDNYSAHIFLAMRAIMVNELRPKEIKRLDKEMDKTIHSSWPAFQYENIKGSPAISFINQLFPIQESGMEKLANKYLTPLIH